MCEVNGIPKRIQEVTPLVLRIETSQAVLNDVLPKFLDNIRSCHPLARPQPPALEVREVGVYTTLASVHALNDVRQPLLRMSSQCLWVCMVSVRSPKDPFPTLAVLRTVDKGRPPVWGTVWRAILVMR